MVYSLNYRRPSKVASLPDSFTGDEKQKSIDESITSGASSGLAAGIPDALSFDRIITGGTCPPVTTRDFMNYLKYIEHSAENLQFFLWHRDYTKRFSELPRSERDLSPEWTVAQAEAEALAAREPRKLRLSPETAAMLKGTSFGGQTTVTETEIKGDPFHTPPRTPSSDERRDESPGAVSMVDEDSSRDQSATRSSTSQGAQAAFEKAGLKWQPFTVQPFREEIARVINIYIADGGSRQLNLSCRERTALLHALENTTHPSAFRDVVTTVEWSLRCQAHPNFIRWTICNGNRPRVIFARGLGVGVIIAGILTAIILTLSNVGRGWRVLSLPLFLIGVSTLIAAWKGMCVVLHGLHHRHLRPWELFSEVDEAVIDMDIKKESVESMGSNNSYEDAPWVARYEKRNIIRKVFDREVWIQEPALRQIQDTIFVQSLLGAFIISAVSVGIFCAIPKGGFF